MKLSPLNFRSQLLLAQLDLQCHVARKQLVLYRLASSSPAIKLSGAQKVVEPTKSAPAATTPSSPPPPPPNKADEEDHTPKPLSRPLGFPKAPIPGENDGIDYRTWRQRRDDFFNYDKHLARRQQLTHKISKPYFRDWSNMRHHKGKTFVAAPKLFRADRALYFPNLRGVTLAEPKDEQDTTVVLQDMVSIVCVFQGTWAERQTKTFAEDEGLKHVLSTEAEWVQRMDINMEDNSMKAALVRLFMGGLRKQLPQEQHQRYFLVTRGISEEMKLDMGIVNSQVGYVFLLDSKCRMRWAGSADALEEEKASLIRGIGKLVQELKKEDEDMKKTVSQKPKAETPGRTDSASGPGTLAETA